VTAERLEKWLKAAANQTAQDRTLHPHVADPGGALDLLDGRRTNEVNFDSLDE
jgi:hypothetical protein